MKSLKGLVGLVTGLFLISGAIYSYNKKEEITDFIKEAYSTEEVMNSTRTLVLNLGHTEKKEEFPFIGAKFDKNTNTIYVTNQSQDYNKQNWSGTEKEHLPVHKRHTRINQTYSKVVVIHPPSVKISSLEEKAYLIPQYEWEKLIPLNEHEEGKRIVEGGKRIVDWVISQIPSEKVEEIIREELASSGNFVTTTNYKEIQKIAGQGYIATLIPQYIPQKIIGNTITAIEYKIGFNSEEKSSQVFILERIAFGETPEGISEFKEGYGEIEEIIKFNVSNNTLTTKEDKSIETKEVELREKTPSLQKRIADYFKREFINTDAEKAILEYIHCLDKSTETNRNLRSLQNCQNHFVSKEEYETLLEERYTEIISLNNFRNEKIDETENAISGYFIPKKIPLNEIREINKRIIQRELFKKNTEIKTIAVSKDKETFGGICFFVANTEKDWKIISGTRNCNFN